MRPPNADRRAQPIEKRQRGNWPAWLIAGIGALCFLNSLSNGFVYDDMPIVRDNPRIRSLANFSQIWLTDWWRPADVEQDVLHRRRDRLYRPLTMYTIALNYAVSGPRPLGYHATNILLHAAACFLVWRLAQRLLGDRAISNCAALIFAVHPIHAEAVANVVGRAEVLATLFLLAGLLALLPSGRPPGAKHALLAAPLFLAALFSKETAVCYLPVALLALQAVALRPDRGRAQWWLLHTGVLLAPLVVYLPLRYVALEHHLLRDTPPHILLNPLVVADWPHRLLHVFTIFGYYTRLLIAPVDLSANYGLGIINPDGGPNLMTALGFVAALALGVALYGYRRPAGIWRHMAVLVALSLASYVLISNTVLLIGVSLAERLLYWPSVPMLLALTAGVVYLWRYATRVQLFSPEIARLVRICAVALPLALGLRTVVRNMDWASNPALFGRDVETYPQSAELNIAYANELLFEVQQTLRRGDRAGIRPLVERADQYLVTALKIDPREPEALLARGRTLGMLGDREHAIAYLEESSQLGPLDSVSRQLLAQLRQGTAPTADRLAEVRAQLSTRPADAALHRDYGELLLQHGQDRDALKELEEAVRLSPQDAEAVRLLGDAYVARSETERAIETYRRAIALAPDDWRPRVNLVTLLAGSEPEEALRQAQEAYRLQPDAVVTQRQLAEALIVNGRVAEALTLYRKLVASLPPDDPSRQAIEGRIRDLDRQTP